MVLIAPAIVDGVTRLLVGTFVEIHTVGVESCSAGIGVDSADSVDPDWPGEVVETAGWTGSTFKFAGTGIAEVEDGLFKS
jgi:hypothetical protein